MRDKEKRSDQPDKEEAAEERPVPSQAEGDLETVEEDLAQKEKQTRKGGSSSGTRE